VPVLCNILLYVPCSCRARTKDRVTLTQLPGTLSAVAMPSATAAVTFGSLTNSSGFETVILMIPLMMVSGLVVTVVVVVAVAVVLVAVVWDVVVNVLLHVVVVLVVVVLVVVVLVVAVAVVVVVVVIVVRVEVTITQTGSVPLNARSDSQESVSGTPAKCSAQLTVQLLPITAPLQLWLYCDPTGIL